MAGLDTVLRYRDMRALYKHLKRMVGLGGSKTNGQHGIKDENGNMLRDKRDILRRWERFFGNLLNTESPTLQPSIVEEVQQRRKASPPPPGARAQIGEPILLKAEPTHAETLHAYPPVSSACGEGRKSHRSGKTQRSRCSTRSRTDPTATISEGSRSSPTPAKYC